MSRLKDMRGFTLVELMITIALLGVVATIAVPNFVQFIRNNQVQAKADELKTFLQYARGQAVTNRTSYEVTAGADTWSIKPKGKSVERRLEFNTAQAQARTNIESNTITFASNGSVSSALNISVCRADDNANGYLISVPPSGAIRMQLRGVDVPNGCEFD